MGLDLAEMFRLDENLFELFLRTTIIYLGLVAAMRLLGRREMGSLAIPDLLMLVLIADGVQNGMAGDYQSVTGGLVVAGTLLGWNWTLDVLSFRYTFVRRLIQPSELTLVEHGRMHRRNMRRELISRDELLSELRAQGIEDIADVKRACFEPDGQLSVIKFKPDDEGGGGQGRRSAVG